MSVQSHAIPCYPQCTYDTLNFYTASCLAACPAPACTVYSSEPTQNYYRFQCDSAKLAALPPFCAKTVTCASSTTTSTTAISSTTTTTTTTSSEQITSTSSAAHSSTSTAALTSSTTSSALTSSHDTSSTHTATSTGTSTATLSATSSATTSVTSSATTFSQSSTVTLPATLSSSTDTAYPTTVTTSTMTQQVTPKNPNDPVKDASYDTTHPDCHFYAGYWRSDDPKACPEPPCKMAFTSRGYFYWDCDEGGAGPVNEGSGGTTPSNPQQPPSGNGNGNGNGSGNGTPPPTQNQGSQNPQNPANPNAGLSSSSSTTKTTTTSGSTSTSTLSATLSSILEHGSLTATSPYTVSTTVLTTTSQPTGPKKGGYCRPKRELLFVRAMGDNLKRDEI